MQGFGATNKLDTCLWCGRGFNPEVEYIDHGHRFCTLRCGYQFGERYAELGKRLVKKDE